jgi:hypothetical protein
MKIDRPLSSKTWKQIDDLVWGIERRALERKDWQTAKDADLVNALLRNLSMEIGMEDDGLGETLATTQPAAN